MTLTNAAGPRCFAGFNLLLLAVARHFSAGDDFTANGQPQYAICIDNTNYPASLELYKIYRLLPLPKWERDGYVRVIDESGEDYVYPARRFLRVMLPQTIRAILSKNEAATH